MTEGASSTAQQAALEPGARRAEPVDRQHAAVFSAGQLLPGVSVHGSSATQPCSLQSWLQVQWDRGCEQHGIQQEQDSLLDSLSEAQTERPSLAVQQMPGSRAASSSLQTAAAADAAVIVQGKSSLLGPDPPQASSAHDGIPSANHLNLDVARSSLDSSRQAHLLLVLLAQPQLYVQMCITPTAEQLLLHCCTSQLALHSMLQAAKRSAAGVGAETQASGTAQGSAGTPAAQGVSTSRRSLATLALAATVAAALRAPPTRSSNSSTSSRWASAAAL